MFLEDVLATVQKGTRILIRDFKGKMLCDYQYNEYLPFELIGKPVLGMDLENDSGAPALAINVA